MKQLLEGRLSPLAYSWGFLEAPVDAVAAGKQIWATRIGFPLRSKEMAGDLQTILLHLAPLSTFPQREVVVGTQSAWTAYFDNTASGGDPYTPVSYLAQEMKCRGLTVACVPDTITIGDRPGRGTFGGVKFALYGPEETDFLNHVRSIQAINDGGKWVFVANGPIQLFEKPEAYRARRIRDRFIMAYQEIGFKLAEMLTLLQTAQLLAYRAAWMAETGDPEAELLGHCAKVFCAETAERITSASMQVLGQHGYPSGHPAEEGFRNAKYLQIAGTSTEISRIKIGDGVLGRTGNARD